MSAFAIAILIGFLAAAVGWVVFVPLSTPRLEWSPSVASRYGSQGRFQVKVVNKRPWSARDVQVTCIYIGPGIDSDRVVVNVPLRESDIPVIGGWAFRRRRIAKFGWLGASHRVLSIQFGEVGRDNLQRLDPTVRKWLESGLSDSLDELLSDGSELALIAVARDSVFFGRTGVSIHIYRRGDAVVGAFIRGRSTRVLETASPVTTGSSKIAIDDDFLEDVGLGELPEHLRSQLRQYVYDKLQFSVGESLANQMTEDQLDEFEHFIDAKDDAGAFTWLERNFPNYRAVVNEKFEEMRVAVRASAIEILRAEGIEHSSAAIGTLRAFGAVSATGSPEATQLPGT